MISVVLACVVLASTVAVAGDRLAGRDRPRHYQSFQDGPPVTVTLDTGTTWSAWAYRISGEYAIALSSRDPGGLWSDPSFIGLDDRRDQIDPALAADAGGNLYLAFTVRETGVIRVTALRAGRHDWFEPQQVTSPVERAGEPAFRVVGDRLVMGYRVGDETRLVDWELLPASPAGGMTTEGIQDGPDGFPLAVLTPGDDNDDAADSEGREETSDEEGDTSGRADRFGMR
jgi:hypothetical protein